jgi:ABC-type transporter Mla subunit MlaD
MADLPPYPGTPRWVKVFGIIGIVVVLLVSIILVTGVGGPGGHGPGRHTPPIEHGVQQP